MKITNFPNYVVLEDEKFDIKDFVSFLEKQIKDKYQNQNVVVNLLPYKSFELKDLLLFLKISDEHRKNKNSFVLVNNLIEIDDIPPELVVVPTLQEAGDIIEMEEIERDLGF